MSDKHTTTDVVYFVRCVPGGCGIDDLDPRDEAGARRIARRANRECKVGKKHRVIKRTITEEDVTDDPR